MFFYLVFLVLALAVNSAAFPSPTTTELPAQGDSLELEWAAASVYLNGSSFSVGLNDSERIGDSLSDVWDLPAGLLFCNFSSENTINHNYVTTLVNGL